MSLAASPSGLTVKSLCSGCGGGPKNHRVLGQHHRPWDDGGVWGGVHYQIVECQGCEEIRFRSVEWNSQEYDFETEGPAETVRVYPEHLESSRAALLKGSANLPLAVDRIYRETITALNVGVLILAGAGLRAIVEAICISAKAPGRNLQDRIDGLVTLGLLAKAQADLLHEERFLGNKAVHEVEPPSRDDVEDGMAIVEALLSTMFVVPASARRLRESRLKRTSGDSELEPKHIDSSKAES